MGRVADIKLAFRAKTMPAIMGSRSSMICPFFCLSDAKLADNGSASSRRDQDAYLSIMRSLDQLFDWGDHHQQ